MIDTPNVSVSQSRSIQKRKSKCHGEREIKNKISHWTQNTKKKRPMRTHEGKLNMYIHTLS